LATLEEVGGGSISRAFVVGDGTRRWFVKVDRDDALGLFAAEADGLAALRRCPALRVPEVLGHGACGEGNGTAYLVLSYTSILYRFRFCPCRHGV
jgi:fructosamine-3-kinase